MEKRLLTLIEFSAAYSISRNTAYRQEKEGQLRFTKVGRRTYVSQTDAEAWLKKLQQSSSASPNCKGRGK